MRIIDVTGAIENGMWSYGPPYPEVVIEEIPQPDFIEHQTFSWRFELGAQTGTYLETSLHVTREGPALIEIPVEQLIGRDAAILRVPCAPDHRIEAAELEACGVPVNPGDAVIVATGWDERWNAPDFVSNCPWFSYGAMRWLLDREPFMICGDMPRFDFRGPTAGLTAGVLRRRGAAAGAAGDLGAVRADRVKLTALPLKWRRLRGALSRGADGGVGPPDRHRRPIHLTMLMMGRIPLSRQ